MCWIAAHAVLEAAFWSFRSSAPRGTHGRRERRGSVLGRHHKTSSGGIPGRCPTCCSPRNSISNSRALRSEPAAPTCARRARPARRGQRGRPRHHCRMGASSGCSEALPRLGTTHGWLTSVRGWRRCSAASGTDIPALGRRILKRGSHVDAREIRAPPGLSHHCTDAGCRLVLSARTLLRFGTVAHEPSVAKRSPAPRHPRHECDRGSRYERGISADWRGRARGSGASEPHHHGTRSGNVTLFGCLASRDHFPAPGFVHIGQCLGDDALAPAAAESRAFRDPPNQTDQPRPAPRARRPLRDRPRKNERPQPICGDTQRPSCRWHGNHPGRAPSKHGRRAHPAPTCGRSP